jgi:hypothetical protein
MTDQGESEEEGDEWENYYEDSDFVVDSEEERLHRSYGCDLNEELHRVVDEMEKAQAEDGPACRCVSFAGFELPRVCPSLDVSALLPGRSHSTRAVAAALWPLLSEEAASVCYWRVTSAHLQERHVGFIARGGVPVVD